MSIAALGSYAYFIKKNKVGSILDNGIGKYWHLFWHRRVFLNIGFIYLQNIPKQIFRKNRL